MCHFDENRETFQELVRLLGEKDTSWEVNINSQAMSPCESDKKPEIEECSSKLSQKKRTKLRRKFNQ